jgi:hypothetical protein
MGTHDPTNPMANRAWSLAPSIPATPVIDSGMALKCRLCCKSILELVLASDGRKRFLPVSDRELRFSGRPATPNEILSVVPSIRRQSDFYNKICHVRTHALQQNVCLQRLLL